MKTDKKGFGASTRRRFTNLKKAFTEKMKKVGRVLYEKLKPLLKRVKTALGKLLGPLFEKIKKVLDKLLPRVGGRRKPGIFAPRFRAEPLAAVVEGEILDRYAIDQAVVIIVDKKGKGYYLVQEPPLTAEEQRIYSLLMENLYYSLRPTPVSPEDPMRYVEKFLYETAEELGVLKEVHKSFRKYRYYLARDAFGYGPIHAIMNDPRVEEVSCVGYGTPVSVIHRDFTHYDWLETNVIFASEERLKAFVQKLAQRANKSVTVAVPFIDMMTREGHRVAVTFSDEVTLPGSSFTIRKFPETPLSMAHIIKNHTLSPLMAAYLWLIEEYRGLILVLGPMGSGKTTLANTLLTMLSPSLKIATIEDTPELRIPHTSWERFKARHAYSITTTKYDVDLFDLIKLSLRYRPDYIAVGEIRGGEAKALIQAASLGHGCISTLHAEGPESALIRLTTAPMNVEKGSLLLVWAFATMRRIRMPSGRMVRRLVDISETVEKGGRLTINRVFYWSKDKDKFFPSTAKEVVRKSERLKKVAAIAGWTQKDLLEELIERTEYLKQIIDEKRLSYAEFSEAIREFYGRREKR